jgi:hypothetical protein
MEKELLSIIQKKDVLSYKELLKHLSNTDDLLIPILTQIEKEDFREAVKPTLDYWGGMETGFDEYYGEIYPILPTLFLDENISFQILYFIMDVLRDEVSVEEIAIELFEKGEGDSLRNALKNLFDMLGQPSGATYRVLSEQAFKSENTVAIEFFSGLQSYYTDVIQKPNYIIDGDEEFEEKDLVELATEISNEIYNRISYEDINECVEYLTKGLSECGVDVDEHTEMKKILYLRLFQMNIEERKKYLRRFMRDEIDENVSLFNIMGPSNSRDDNVSTKSSCEQYGCRMLNCVCFEYHLLDPTNHTDLELDWFNGKCEKCERDIPKKCYAVRRPLAIGGWLGTYCSWNCLNLSGCLDIRDKELAGLYEKKMKEMKIMNRKENK